MKYFFVSLIIFSSFLLLSTQAYALDDILEGIDISNIKLPLEIGLMIDPFSADMTGEMTMIKGIVKIPLDAVLNINDIRAELNGDLGVKSLNLELPTIKDLKVDLLGELSMEHAPIIDFDGNVEMKLPIINKKTGGDLEGTVIPIDTNPKTEYVDIPLSVIISDLNIPMDKPIQDLSVPMKMGIPELRIPVMETVKLKMFGMNIEPDDMKAFLIIHELEVNMDASIQIKELKLLPSGENKLKLKAIILMNTEEFIKPMTGQLIVEPAEANANIKLGRFKLPITPLMKTNETNSDLTGKLSIGSIKIPMSIEGEIILG